MRLWSLHPKYLDSKGIVALWREALLAQKVLLGKTKGYKHHPQLKRFKLSRNPQGAIAAYLRGVWTDAKRRGYEFNGKKISGKPSKLKIKVTDGQMKYEFEWLCRKLKMRDPKTWTRIKLERHIEAHAVFLVEAGPIESWERAVAK